MPTAEEYASGERRLARVRPRWRHRTMPRSSPMTMTRLELITSVQRRRLSTGRGISPVVGIQNSPLWRGW
jgi:hypothetical protein